MRRLIPVLVSLGLILPLLSAGTPCLAKDAKQSPQSSQGASNPLLKVREVHLENGMTFLLYPRGEAPIFSAYIRFRAGGVDEEEGKTGLAHFLEHMAFKGTESIGTKDYVKEKPLLDEINQVGGELAAEYAKEGKADPKRIKELRDRLRSLHGQQVPYLEKEQLAKMMLERGGGDYNATTSKDMTSYFVSLPADQIQFWAEVESERIFKPIFREFYEEKDVVLEERRMRVDDDPDGRLYEAFLEKAFQKSPYRWATIGSQKDVLKLTVQDLEAFWRKYYDPANAVGAVVGKFKPKQVEAILRETFGKIRFNGLPKSRYDFPQEPEQTQERRVHLQMQARPRIIVGYHKPTLPSDDDYLFDLLDQILGDGRSSRLYQSLVTGQKLVSHVETSSSIPGSRLENLFMVELSPLNHDSQEVLEALDQEIEKIKTFGVTQEEFDRARNRLRVDFMWQLKTNEGLASQLSYFQVIAGSWRYLADYLDKIDQFSPEDIQRIAKKYLTPNNRTIAILEP